ncbi:hypothetical protein LDENG_00215790, partial [Lucifuga dentata]
NPSFKLSFSGSAKTGLSSPPSSASLNPGSPGSPGSLGSGSRSSPPTTAVTTK